MQPTLSATDTPAVGWQQPFWFAIAGLFIALMMQNTELFYTDTEGQADSWIGFGEATKVAFAFFLPVMLLLWKAGAVWRLPCFWW